MSISEKLQKIAENEQKVYEAGKRAEYDRFWDNYQNLGYRENYAYAFAGEGWYPDLFKPKYQFAKNTYNTQYMFSMFNRSKSNQNYVPDFDLAEHLNNLGITLDTSKCSNFTHMYSESDIVRIPELNVTSCSTFWVFASNSKIKIIDKIILKADGSTLFNTTFNGLNDLEQVTFEGAIGQNGFNVQWSTKLTHDSLMSIINHLQDKSTDTSGTTWLITLGEANKGKLTESEIAIAEAKGWEVS